MEILKSQFNFTPNLLHKQHLNLLQFPVQVEKILNFRDSAHYRLCAIIQHIVDTNLVYTTLGIISEVRPVHWTQN